MNIFARLHRFLLRPAVDPGTSALYRACVAQARQPVFYKAFGVPDTVDGRFDLLTLHVWLVMRRLDGAQRQRLFDLMFADMDRSLREMGVGDMSVGKKIRPMISAFYGRTKAYEQALTGGKDELAAALARNLCGLSDAMSNGYRLADYVQRAMRTLDAQAPIALARGELLFAPPENAAEAA